MTTTLSFDHLVLVVRELEAATRDFSSFGFKVTPGGVHAGGLTHNALVAFSDGSYLELLAPTRPSRIERYGLLLDCGELRRVTAGMNAFQRRFIHHLARFG